MSSHPLHREGAARRRVFTLVAQALLLLAVASMAVPLVWTVFLSLKTNNAIFTDTFSLPIPPEWGNYAAALKVMNLPLVVKNTLVVAAAALPLGLLFTLFGSFALSRMKIGSGRVQNYLYLYFISGVITPVYVILFPVYRIVLGLGVMDTLWALILPHIGWFAPMNTLILYGAFKSVPVSLEEAAVLDGCNIFDILFRIYLPVLKPSVATVFIIDFLNIWNDFALARVVLTSPAVRTVSLAVSLFKGMYSMNYAHMTAAVVILVVPQLLVFSFFQKYIIDGITAGSVKG